MNSLSSILRRAGASGAVLLSLMLSSAPRASAMPGAAEKEPELELALHVDSFRVTRVSQEKAEAEIQLSVTADLDAQIEHVDFANFHLNGVPVFAAPIDAPLELHRKQSLQLPPVTVTVYLADLDSMEPLMRVLDEQKAQLVAEIELRVHATVLEHVVLGSGHPVAVVDVDQPVAVQGPEGLMGRTSAMALLRLAQVALDGGLLQRNGDAGWSAQMAASRTGLLHARSCHSTRKGAQDETCVDELAFRLGAGQGANQGVASPELGQPWRFEPALARTFEAQGGHLASDPTLTVQGLGLAEGAAQTAVFAPVGEAAKESKILYPGHSRETLLQTETPGCYGRLTLTGEGAGFRAATGGGSFDRLLVFRLVRGGDGGWSAKPVYLSGTVEGKKITFSRPVDRAAIGSPILTPEGVVGVVQGESGGTLLANDGAAVAR